MLGLTCTHSVQFSSVTQSCLTLCEPMNHSSTPGVPVRHQLPEFSQTHVHRIGDVIQPSHPLSCPSPAPNPSQHQGLFQCINSLHEDVQLTSCQPAGGRKCFPRVHRIPEHGFLCYRNKQSYFLLEKC